MSVCSRRYAQDGQHGNIDRDRHHWRYLMSVIIVGLNIAYMDFEGTCASAPGDSLLMPRVLLLSQERTSSRFQRSDHIRCAGQAPGSAGQGEDIGGNRQVTGLAGTFDRPAAIQLYLFVSLQPPCGRSFLTYNSSSQPSVAVLLTLDDNGEIVSSEEIPSYLLQLGDVLLVRPGSGVPADGIVVWGNSSG